MGVRAADYIFLLTASLEIPHSECYKITTDVWVAVRHVNREHLHNKGAKFNVSDYQILRLPK